MCIISDVGKFVPPGVRTHRIQNHGYSIDDALLLVGFDRHDRIVSNSLWKACPLHPMVGAASCMISHISGEDPVAIRGKKVQDVYMRAHTHTHTHIITYT